MLVRCPRPSLSLYLLMHLLNKILCPQRISHHLRLVSPIPTLFFPDPKPYLKRKLAPISAANTHIRTRQRKADLLGLLWHEVQAHTCRGRLRIPAHASTLRCRQTPAPAPLAQRQVRSHSATCLLACPSPSTTCMAGCQLRPAHLVIVINLQAVFLWHHSKDCIQVQHNLTRYKGGNKPSFYSSAETLPFCDVPCSC